MDNAFLNTLKKTFLEIGYEFIDLDENLIGIALSGKNERHIYNFVINHFLEDDSCLLMLSREFVSSKYNKHDLLDVFNKLNISKAITGATIFLNKLELENSEMKAVFYERLLNNDVARILDVFEDMLGILEEFDKIE